MFHKRIIARSCLIDFYLQLAENGLTAFEILRVKVIKILILIVGWLAWLILVFWRNFQMTDLFDQTHILR